LSVSLLNRGTVLITRPDGDSRQISNDIKAKGYDVLCVPFLNVILHEQKIDDLESYAGLIFTSRNGVRAYCQNTQKRDLPVWVIGDATADIARAEGFSNIHNAKGGVQDLEDILKEVNHEKPLLYIRGRDVARDIEGKNIQEKVLYHTEKIEQIDNAVMDSIEAGDFSHITFFSTRTAQAFIECVEAAGIKNGLRRTKALCLGDSMLKSLSVLPWRSIEAADAPNRKILVTLLD